MIDSIEASVGIYAASLIVAVLSGLVPIVNGELYLIGVVLATRSVPAAIALAVIVAVGQMIAKFIIYKGASSAALLSRPGSKTEARLEKGRALMERWKSKPLALIFISGTFGLPPFYVVTLIAGLLRIHFRAFLILGLIGRVLRFVTIALLAVLL